MQLCGMRMQNSCSLSEATSALLCHLLRGLQCYDEELDVGERLIFQQSCQCRVWQASQRK